MPRRPTVARKAKYEEQLAGTALTLDQFTNKLMRGGKRQLASRILEGAIAQCEKSAGRSGVEVMESALKAAFIAFIARTTDPRYTATQFALFTSLAVVPRTLINATTGWIVEQIGWFDFFLLCTVLALPGMALLLRVAPWNAPIPAGD